MFQFTDNEQVYVIHAGEKTAKSAEKSSRIAFGITGEISSLNVENSTQFDKILASVKQTRENTQLFDFSYTDISFNRLTEVGVTAIVIFANQIPEFFASLNVKTGQPFTIANVHVYLAPNLQTLSQSPPAKMALWNFMKTQIG